MCMENVQCITLRQYKACIIEYNICMLVTVIITHPQLCRHSDIRLHIRPSRSCLLAIAFYTIPIIYIQFVEYILLYIILLLLLLFLLYNTGNTNSIDD